MGETGGGGVGHNTRMSALKSYTDLFWLLHYPVLYNRKIVHTQSGYCIEFTHIPHYI